MVVAVVVVVHNVLAKLGVLVKHACTGLHLHDPGLAFPRVNGGAYLW